LAATLAGAVTAARGLDALAGDRHQQPQTVIAHRFLPVGMANDPAKRFDIGGKSRFTPSTRCLVHSGPPTGQGCSTLLDGLK
jgi:hypothetical protein